MSFIKRDIDQPNLIDGSVYAYQAYPDGAYVTVAGNDPDDIPLILAFDVEDIEALRDVVAHFDRMNAS
jgi:hypothetical protein